MIYIQKQNEENNSMVLQIPVNSSFKFPLYNFVLLNMQSKKVSEFTELADTSLYEGYFQFPIDLSYRPELVDGTYYYQLFGYENPESNKYICTTGLCRITSTNTTVNNTTYHSNSNNIVYHG